jgi:hypothetical protein
MCFSHKDQQLLCVACWLLVDPSVHLLPLASLLKLLLPSAVHSPFLSRCAASGMDFYVVLERPGFRVARRRAPRARVGVQHRIGKEDAIKWWVWEAGMEYDCLMRLFV